MLLALVIELADSPLMPAMLPPPDKTAAAGVQPRRVFTAEMWTEYERMVEERISQKNQSAENFLACQNLSAKDMQICINAR